MKTYNTLRYEVADKILTLTLNRPDQMNAFTVEMARELVHAFERASEDDEVGAIVVTGAGKAFCAGMDLSVPGNVFEIAFCFDCKFERWHQWLSSSNSAISAS